MAEHLAGFPHDGPEFVAGLAADNTRSFFDTHRSTYERDLLAPMCLFVTDLADLLRDTVAPALQAEPPSASRCSASTATPASPRTRPRATRGWTPSGGRATPRRAAPRPFIFRLASPRRSQRAGVQDAAKRPAAPAWLLAHAVIVAHFYDVESGRKDLEARGGDPGRGRVRAYRYTGPARLAGDLVPAVRLPPRRDHRRSHDPRYEAHVYWSCRRGASPDTGRQSVRSVPDTNAVPASSRARRSASLRAVSLTSAVTQRDPVDPCSPMPAADSALRDRPGNRRRARCPSTTRGSVPVAGGQILLGLTRAVCGMSALTGRSGLASQCVGGIGMAAGLWGYWGGGSGGGGSTTTMTLPAGLPSSTSSTAAAASVSG